MTEPVLRSIAHRIVRCCGQFLVLILSLLSAFTASAQPQPPTTLTLEQALELADSQSLDIRRAELALQRAAVGVRVVEEQLNAPQATLGADYVFNIQRQVFFVSPDIPFNETGMTQAFPVSGRHGAGISLNVAQPLYNPMRRLRLRVASSHVDVARAQLDVARATVRLEAERAFYRAVYARVARAVRDSQIVQAKSNLAFTVARFAQGRAMPIDTIAARATLIRANADAQRAQFVYRSAVLQLARLLDIRSYDSLEVVGDLSLPDAPGPGGGDLTIEPGRMNSAGLALAIARLQAARASADAEARTLLPTLHAVATVQGLGQSPHTLPDEWTWAMTSSVGLSATINLAELWTGDPRREDALVRVREAELEIENLRRLDSTAMETALLNMRGAQAQLAAEEASVEAARRQIEITTILYREGRATWLDVETAQSRMLDAELAEDLARLQFLENYAELKAIIGEEPKR